MLTLKRTLDRKRNRLESEGQWVSTESPLVDADAPSVTALSGSSTEQASPGLHRAADSHRSYAVSIEYCAPGNLERTARELADAILAEFGEETQLVESRDGSFEVLVDGRLVFSKRASWRLPDADEIFYHVRNR